MMRSSGGASGQLAKTPPIITPLALPILVEEQEIEYFVATADSPISPKKKLSSAAAAAPLARLGESPTQSPRVQVPSEKNIRIVAVGDGSCGAKTCLLKTYANGSWPDEMFAGVPTVQDTYTREVIYQNTTVTFVFEDTSGQEEYESLRTQAYASADLILLGYSVVSIPSFENVAEKWFPEVRKHCPTTPVILVGSKVDLIKKEVADKNRTRSMSASTRITPSSFVTGEDALLMKDRVEAIAQFQISNITGEAVHDLFEFILAFFVPKEKGSIGGTIKRRFEGLFHSGDKLRSPRGLGIGGGVGVMGTGVGGGGGGGGGDGGKRASMHERSRSSGMDKDKEITPLASPRNKRNLSIPFTLSATTLITPSTTPTTTAPTTPTTTEKQTPRLSARKRSISSDGMETIRARFREKEEKQKKKKTPSAINRKKSKKKKQLRKAKSKEEMGSPPSITTSSPNLSTITEQEASIDQLAPTPQQPQQPQQQSTEDNNNTPNNKDNKDNKVEGCCEKVSDSEDVQETLAQIVVTGETGERVSRIRRAHRRHSSHGTKLAREEPERPSVLYGKKLPLAFYELNNIPLSMSLSGVGLRESDGEEDEDKDDDDDDDDDGDGTSSDDGEVVEQSEHSGPTGQQPEESQPQAGATGAGVRVTIRRLGKRGGEVVRLPEDEEQLLRIAEERLSDGSGILKFVCVRTPPPNEAKISYDLIKEGDILCFTTEEEEKEFD